METKTKLQKYINSEKDVRHANFCKEFNCNTYLSGSGANKYTDNSVFQNNNINIQFIKFKHPVYNQYNNNGFTSHLSILDMLFNLGAYETRKCLILF